MKTFTILVAALSLLTFSGLAFAGSSENQCDCPPGSHDTSSNLSLTGGSNLTLEDYLE